MRRGRSSILYPAWPHNFPNAKDVARKRVLLCEPSLPPIPPLLPMGLVSALSRSTVLWTQFPLSPGIDDHLLSYCSS
jgi:hypothetical protein